MTGPAVVTRWTRSEPVTTLEWTGGNAAAVREFCGRRTGHPETSPEVFDIGGLRALVWNTPQRHWIPCPVGHHVARTQAGVCTPVPPEALGVDYYDGPPGPVECPERPELLVGMPLGQYHCPACMCMVIAGLPHGIHDDGCRLGLDVHPSAAGTVAALRRTVDELAAASRSEQLRRIARYGVGGNVPWLADLLEQAAGWLDREITGPDRPVPRHVAVPLDALAAVLADAEGFIGGKDNQAFAQLAAAAGTQ